MEKKKQIEVEQYRKLNSIEKLISKELLDSDISHEEFMLVVNDEQNLNLS